MSCVCIRICSVLRESIIHYLVEGRWGKALSSRISFLTFTTMAWSHCSWALDIPIIGLFGDWSNVQAMMFLCLRIVVCKSLISADQNLKWPLEHASFQIHCLLAQLQLRHPYLTRPFQKLHAYCLTTAFLQYTGRTFAWYIIIRTDNETT